LTAEQTTFGLIRDDDEEEGEEYNGDYRNHALYLSAS
jgi:hypothetical protein